MKVLYDYQTFTIQQFGGISRYHYELAERFSKDPDMEVEIALRYTYNHYLRNSDLGQDLKPPQPNLVDRAFNKLQFRGKSKAYKLYRKFSKGVQPFWENKQTSTEAVKKGDFDIFHPTYYVDDYFLDLIGNKPWVITNHDMTYEMFPEFFPFSDTTPITKKKIMQRADHIIAVSENSKRDTVKFLNIDPKKIKVIYHGSSMDPDSSGVDLDLPDRYVLFVGNRGLYKNFYFFAQAISHVMQDDPKLHLVAAGGPAISAEEKRYLEYLEIADRTHHVPFKDNATLAYCYKNALAFVFPSLYEGFGIPALEAMSCDCPAIIANNSSLPEVGGDAAEYFDAKDLNSIQDAIKKVIYSDKKREQMISKGRKQRDKFSWDKCAAETKAYYEEILS